MITLRPGRQLDRAAVVSVYRNLRTGRWSIRQSGLVVAHGADFGLELNSVIVRSGGLARVRARRQREVFAWLNGRLLDAPRANGTRVRVRFDPYTDDTFRPETGGPLTPGEHVQFTASGGCYVHRSETP